MSNLSVENLNRVVQTGDLEGLMNGGRGVSRERIAVGSDAAAAGGGEAAGGDGTLFSDVLQKSMEKVNELQHQANDAVHELVAGRSKNIHETMLAIERADTSLKMMMQVRNKVLDAYREIMRMQV